MGKTFSHAHRSNFLTNLFEMFKYVGATAGNYSRLLELMGATREDQQALVKCSVADSIRKYAENIAAVPNYVKNVCRCGICGAAADRDHDILICQSNPGHRGDTWTGIFSDLSWHGDAKQVTSAN